MLLICTCASMLTGKESISLHYNRLPLSRRIFLWSAGIVGIRLPGKIFLGWPLLTCELSYTLNVVRWPCATRFKYHILQFRPFEQNRITKIRLQLFSLKYKDELSHFRVLIAVDAITILVFMLSAILFASLLLYYSACTFLCRKR